MTSRARLRRARLPASVALASLVGLGLVGRSRQEASPPVIESAAPEVHESTAVVRQTLIESESFDALLSHGTPVPLAIDAEGMVTWAPKNDDLLRPGDVAIRIDDRPVILVDGLFPLYRELRKIGASERDEAGNKLGLQEGQDVLQLQAYLVSKGFNDDGKLSVDGTFGISTQRAVKDWQESIGHPASGRIDRTQMLFVNSNLRVEQTALVGQNFDNLLVTAPTQSVRGSVPSTVRSFFTTGSVVEVEAGGETFAGVIVELKRQPAEGGTTRYSVLVEIREGPLPEGSEAVEVTAHKIVNQDALTVPVRAILALAEGGWAVEVGGPTGAELRRVELVDVVGTTAAITGIDEGTEVVVPT